MPVLRRVGAAGAEQPGDPGRGRGGTQTAALTAWPGESASSTITTHLSFAAPVRSRGPHLVGGITMCGLANAFSYFIRIHTSILDRHTNKQST